MKYILIILMYSLTFGQTGKSVLTQAQKDSIGAIISDSLANPKVYTALLNQIGTNNPTAMILKNTIGNIVWTREDTGLYEGTLSDAFTRDKTYISLTPSPSGNVQSFNAISERANTVSISLKVFEDGDWVSSDFFNNLYIEIKVYPASIGGDTTGNYLTNLHIARVEADGGIVYDAVGLKSFINQSVNDTSFNKMYAVYDPNWGIKKDINNRVSKLYNVKYSSDNPDLIQFLSTVAPTLQQFENDGAEPTALRSIVFDGINNYMNTGLASTWVQPTQIITGMKHILDKGRYIYDGNTNLSGALFQTGSPNALNIYSGTGGIDEAFLGVGAMGVVNVLFKGASSFKQVNDDAKVYSITGTEDMQGFNLAARANLGSTFSNLEIGTIVISDELTSTEETNLKDFISSRWLTTFSTSNIVVCMGNSLTNLAYTNQLRKLLGTSWNVSNKGVSGETTTNMLTRYATDVTSNANAKYAVILAGINDIILDSTKSAAYIIANLDSMYELNYNAGIRTVAVTLTPFKNNVYWSTNKQVKLDSVNAWILGNIGYTDYRIDAYSAFEDSANSDSLSSEYDRGDHLHFSTIGYNYLGSLVDSSVTWDSVKFLYPNYWTWNLTATAITDNHRKIVKDSGTDYWDGQAYTSEGYVDSVYASMTPLQSDAYTIFGLSTAPESTPFHAQEYAWYLKNDGGIQCFESGTWVDIDGFYQAGDTFLITYNGTDIKYYHNGTLKRTVARATGDPLYLDCSFWDIGSGFNNIVFTGVTE